MPTTNYTISNTVSQTSRNSVNGSARTIIFMTFTPSVSGLSVNHYDEANWHIPSGSVTFTGLTIQLIRVSDSAVMASGSAVGISGGVATGIGAITFSPNPTLVSGVQYKIVFAYTACTASALFTWTNTGTAASDARVSIALPGPSDGQGGLNYDVFTNVAPNAPTLTTKANCNMAAAQTFTWTFSDSDVGDTQGAYQLQILRASDSAVIVDTGKVSSAVASYNLAAFSLVHSTQYQWKVTTWDQSDVQGPYSSLSNFTTFVPAGLFSAEF